MNTQIHKDDRRRGTVLMVVMGMMAIGTIAVGSILGSALTKMRLADKQLSMEQAFYIAQAGAERAATRVAEGQTTSFTLPGNFGEGSFVAEVTYNPRSGGDFDVDIVSVGTVKSQTRTITMRGVRRSSWARYALWYDKEATKLWIAPGEKFGGPVYSTPQFHFHHQDLATKGQVEFSERASSGASTIEKSTNAVDPIFNKGLALKAPKETMASISFSGLLASANSGGLVLYGPTTIVMDGSGMLVTNSDAKYKDKRLSLPANGLLYVRNKDKSNLGNVNVSAPAGMKGQLTIVADNDINIVNHIKYATDPRTNPNSTDALGLIAQKSIVVETSTPNNVYIFAHMIAVNGGFGVKDYDKIKNKGDLNVYGGIVNLTRNAVGIVGGAGYAKNYIFDTRFARNPPPNYPKLVDELEWTEWEG